MTINLKSNSGNNGKGREDINDSENTNDQDESSPSASFMDATQIGEEVNSVKHDDLLVTLVRIQKDMDLRSDHKR